MDMSSYVREIEHAATTVIKLVRDEQDRLEGLDARVSAMRKQMEEGYERAEFFRLNPELDDELFGMGAYRDTYFGADKEQHYASKEQEELQAPIATLAFSTVALSANLLQYGRQGIPTVHGGLTNCPGGRPVGSQHLRDVIWQGRNQALHWGEGSLRQPVADCFDRLAADYDPGFREY